MRLLFRFSKRTIQKSQKKKYCKEHKMSGKRSIQSFRKRRKLSLREPRLLMQKRRLYMNCFKQKTRKVSFKAVLGNWKKKSFLKRPKLFVKSLKLKKRKTKDVAMIATKITH